MRNEVKHCGTPKKPWEEKIPVDKTRSLPEQLSEVISLSELSEVYLNKSVLQNELLRLGLKDFQLPPKPSVAFDLPYTDNSKLQLVMTENENLFKVLSFEYDFISYMYLSSHTADSIYHLI